jgi:hypothetical protein
MSEVVWTHLGIGAGILIPVFLAWLDTRRQNKRNHRENQERLIEIETKIKPMWKWFCGERESVGLRFRNRYYD